MLYKISNSICICLLSTFNLRIAMNVRHRFKNFMMKYDEEDQIIMRLTSIIESRW